jgi:multicomponent Na+:H+ antiporter subunit G
MTTAEWIASAFLLTGSAFLLLAGAALVRMPDLYMRISASSKAVTAGAGSCFIAGAIAFTDAGVAARAFAGLAFFLLTSPVSAHVVGRAAVHLGVPFWRQTTLPRDSRSTADMTQSR